MWKPLPDLECDLTLNTTENKLINDFPFVFPNPATTQLTIETYASSIDKIEIHTLLGQVIGSYTIDSQSIKTIDINNLPDGIYIVYFSENGILKGQEKLIKQ